eukprot:3306533-Prymnesium_polylepis.1
MDEPAPRERHRDARLHTVLRADRRPERKRRARPDVQPARAVAPPPDDPLHHIVHRSRQLARHP